MTCAGRVPGCVRSPWIAVAALLLALCGSAVAQGPSCVSSCDDPNVAAACEEFRDCQQLFRDAVATCVDEKCQCSEEQPQCRFPATPGRCTITLDCVGKCYRETRRIGDVPTSTACARALKEALRGGDPGCRVSSASARRACNRCVGRIARTCTPPADERGSRCQQQCVRRVLEKRSQSKGCYAKCGRRCNDNSCATSMCERACRNSVCNALTAQCSPEGGDEADDEGGTTRLNVGYQACCNSDTGDCDFDDDTTIGCTPTTTSSTSTSSTSSTSSTASATPTSTTSTSSTLP